MLLPNVVNGPASLRFKNGAVGRLAYLPVRDIWTTNHTRKHELGRNPRSARTAEWSRAFSSGLPLSPRLFPVFRFSRFIPPPRSPRPPRENLSLDQSQCGWASNADQLEPRSGAARGSAGTARRSIPTVFLSLSSQLVCAGVPDQRVRWASNSTRPLSTSSRSEPSRARAS